MIGRVPGIRRRVAGGRGVDGDSVLPCGACCQEGCAQSEEAVVTCRSVTQRV